MSNGKQISHLEKLLGVINSPTMQAIDKIVNSPAMKLARQLQESPVLQSIREIENVTGAHHAILAQSPTLAALQKIESMSAIHNLREVIDSPALRAIRQVEESSSALRHLSGSIDKIVSMQGALTFEQAYQEISIAREVFDLENDSLEDIAENVKSLEETSPKNVLSAEFYINIIFAIFLWHLSNMSAQESEERMVDRLSKLESTIENSIALVENSEVDIYFFVTKTNLNLREGADTSSKSISLIPKNQKLSSLYTEGEWMKVEFFDYMSNTMKTGWVNSNFLIPVIEK